MTGWWPVTAQCPLVTTSRSSVRAGDDRRRFPIDRYYPGRTFGSCTRTPAENTRRPRASPLFGQRLTKRAAASATPISEAGRGPPVSGMEAGAVAPPPGWAWTPPPPPPVTVTVPTMPCASCGLPKYVYVPGSSKVTETFPQIPRDQARVPQAVVRGRGVRVVAVLDPRDRGAHRDGDVGSVEEVVLHANRHVLALRHALGTKSTRIMKASANRYGNRFIASSSSSARILRPHAPPFGGDLKAIYAPPARTAGRGPTRNRRCS